MYEYPWSFSYSFSNKNKLYLHILFIIFSYIHCTTYFTVINIINCLILKVTSLCLNI